MNLKDMFKDKQDLESKTTKQLLLEWLIPCIENYAARVESLQKQIDDMLSKADTVWVIKEKK